MPQMDPETPGADVVEFVEKQTGDVGARFDVSGWAEHAITRFMGDASEANFDHENWRITRRRVPR